jgi:hypothetical protein
MCSTRVENIVMRYRIGFAIGYDEERWNLETFDEDRETFYSRVLEMVAPHQGTIDQPNAKLVFPDGTRSLARALIEIAQREGLAYRIGTFVKYTTAEIRQARFVPFFTKGDFADCDRDGHDLNKYTRILCGDCGTPDDSSMPALYHLDKAKMRKQLDLFYGSNGIMIVSAESFERLMPDIGEWVTSGPAAVVEDGKVVRGEKEYVWMRPKCEVGPYIKAKVLKMCSVCQRPTEIRIRDLDDPFENIFEMNKHTVTSFRGVEAPIALVGNWCGEIRPKRHFGRVRHVIISGALHEKIRKMKLKGFVEADYVIHAADEPGHEPPE